MKSLLIEKKINSHHKQTQCHGLCPLYIMSLWPREILNRVFLQFSVTCVRWPLARQPRIVRDILGQHISRQTMVNCIYGGWALGATQMLYNGGSPHMYFGWRGGQKGLDSEPWQVVPHSEPANGQAYLLSWIVGTTTTHFYFLSWGPRRVTYNLA